MLQNHLHYAPVAHAWLSLLPRRGHLARHMVAGQQGVVLMATMHGALLLHCDLDGGTPDFTVVCFDTNVLDTELVFYVWIAEVNHWRPVAIEAVPIFSS